MRKVRWRLYWIFALVFTSCTLSMGQPGVSFDNFPNPNDTLLYLTDEIPDRVHMGVGGPGKFWNLARLEAPFLQMKIVEPSSSGTFGTRYQDADLVVTDEDGNEQYFVINGNRFDLLGGTENHYKGNANHFSFFRGGIPELVAGMRYEDDRNYETEYECLLSNTEIPDYLSQEFDGMVESVKIKAAMTRRLAADAWGTLLIPTGQYDVLRVRVEDQIDAEVLVRSSASAPWTPVEGRVADKLIGSEEKVHHHFFAEGINQPIATIYNGTDGLASKVVYRVHESQAANFKKPDSKQRIHAFPNPAMSSVRLQLTNLEPGEYTVRFYNILGKALFESKHNIVKPETFKVDLSRFAKGTYLYTLIDSRGKKLVTKRIVVLKP